MPYWGDRIGVSADLGLPWPRCSGLLSDVRLAVSVVDAGVEDLAETTGAVGVVFLDESRASFQLHRKQQFLFAVTVAVMAE
jgi:hypothetical protein